MSFTMIMKYPMSRVKSSGQCEMCKGDPGWMQDSGRLRLEDANGRAVDLMKWTCNKCGYTMLFDLAVPLAVPLVDVNYQEELPGG